MTPAVMTVLAFLMLGERPTRCALAGVACAVAGGVSLALPGVHVGGFGSYIGGALVFFAVVSEGLFTIWRKRVSTTVAAVVNTACS